MKRNFLFFILGIIFLFSLFILFTQFFFYYDMARDGYNAFEIWHDHHLKVLGPPTDISGIFHGVMWYYFLAPFYAIGNGNPLFPGVGILVLSFFSAIPFKKLLTQVTKESSFAWVGTFLYILSPLFQYYAHWLSNPWLSFFVAPFLLYFLWNILDKKNRFFSILVGIAYGLLIQSDFAYILCLITVPFYFFLSSRKVRIINFIFVILGLLLTLSTFVVADIKFKGQTVKSLLVYFTGGHEGKLNISNLFEVIVHKLTEFLNISIIPLPEIGVYIAVIIFLGYLIYKRPQLDKKIISFLGVWTLQLLLFFVFSTGISNSKFVFGPFLASLIMICIYLASKVSTKTTIIVGAFIIALLQMYTIYQSYAISYLPLTVQHGMTYQNETKAIDYTYEIAKGKPFTITSLTNPLFINTTWAYMYEMYGKNKYGYVPYWHGHGQVGLLGNLPEKNFATDLRFFIIEPTTGIPQAYIDKVEFDENKLSDIVDQKQFGTIIVQVRMFHSNKPTPTIPTSLINSPLLNE